MINPHFNELKANYLFAEVNRRAAEYAAAHPDKPLVRLGIGDVTQPLCPAVVEALCRAAQEMGTPEGVKGYSAYEGYEFLRRAISEEYAARGVQIGCDEIFVSDGAKSDMGNILDLFAPGSRVGVTDPVYPAYVDANVLAGNLGGLTFLPAGPATGFAPLPPQTGEKLDFIYLCSPNNPTGAAMSRESLQAWVQYALANGSLLLFDAAYEAYITEPGVPRSIYEIPGAKECALEFRSFSKSAGFTGLRCGFAVVPKELPGQLNALWLRRQAIKYNGCPYPVQRAAEAALSPAGKEQCGEIIAYYQENARLLRTALSERGFTVYGGVNAPYIWLATPNGAKSWDFFTLLLEKAQLVTTPGVGFGAMGEGFMRLTAFGTRADTLEAVRRLHAI